MVKSKKSANKFEKISGCNNTPLEKNKRFMGDDKLSPLVCRKLNFEHKTCGNFQDNTPKAITGHKKIKNIIYFDVEWESPFTGYALSSKVTLANAKKHCPDLLIDYLASTL